MDSVTNGLLALIDAQMAFHDPEGAAYGALLDLRVQVVSKDWAALVASDLRRSTTEIGILKTRLAELRQDLKDKQKELDDVRKDAAKAIPKVGLPEILQRIADDLDYEDDYHYYRFDLG